MDNKDKIILEHLFHNARLTTKELARVTNITQPAAYKRLKNLESEGYISRYDSIINWQAFSFIKTVYFCNELELRLVINQKCCFGIQETIGEYKYLVWCFFKNKEMQKVFEKMLPKKEYFKIELKTANLYGSEIFNLPLKVKNSEVTFRQQKISAKDVKILKALGEGGARKTLKELSDETCLPLDVVWQRKKNLIKNGYFMRFIAQPGNVELGLTVTYVFLRTIKDVLEIPKKCIVLFKTASGLGAGFISSNHKDYLDSLDSFFSQIRDENTEPIILTVKKDVLLNRYPFEFLIE